MFVLEGNSSNVSKNDIHILRHPRGFLFFKLTVIYAL